MMSTAYIPEIVQRDTTPPTWAVEVLDTDQDGGVDVTLFSGPDAKHRAQEYAIWKYGYPDQLAKV